MIVILRTEISCKPILIVKLLLNSAATVTFKYTFKTHANRMSWVLEFVAGVVHEASGATVEA